MKALKILLVSALTLTSVLSGFPSAKADSIVAIDFRGSGKLVCRPDTTVGTTWRHMETDALARLGASRADVAQGVVKLYRFQVRGHFRGNVAVAMGRRSRGTRLQACGNSNNGNGLRGGGTQAMAERDALNFLSKHWVVTASYRRSTKR